MYLFNTIQGDQDSNPGHNISCDKCFYQYTSTFHMWYLAVHPLTCSLCNSELMPCFKVKCLNCVYVCGGRVRLVKFWNFLTNLRLHSARGRWPNSCEVWGTVSPPPPLRWSRGAAPATPLVCLSVCLHACVSVCVSLPVCLCVSVSLYLCACVSLCRCGCVPVCLYGCLCGCLFFCLCVSLCLCQYVAVSVCVCLCLCACVIMYVCMCVYVCVHVCLCMCACLSVCLHVWVSRQLEAKLRWTAKHWVYFRNGINKISQISFNAFHYLTKQQSCSCSTCSG